MQHVQWIFYIFQLTEKIIVGSIDSSDTKKVKEWSQILHQKKNDNKLFTDRRKAT